MQGLGRKEMYEWNICIFTFESNLIDVPHDFYRLDSSSNTYASNHFYFIQEL